MSTFCGRMREYREISIDRFDKENLTSSVYFLSHCHRDHMVGLNSSAFFKHLKTNENIYLYMSDVSKVLLMGDNTYDFTPLEPKIRTLERTTNIITVPKTTDEGKVKILSVTPLPAGHCPGSIMFLFEGEEGRVLYTGDFRWERNHAASIPALRDELGIKHIKSLYIDTTFCIPNAFHFPSRAECVEATVKLIEDWLNRSNSHFVYVASPTNFGHEHLQVEIYKYTKHQIHTSDWKYSMYSQIQDLAEAFTTDPNTRIHACGIKRKKFSKSRLPCGHIFDTEDEELKLLVIRPSTMWFTMQSVRLDKLVEEPVMAYQPHRVCYSFHSSYSEIKDLVSYLNPDNVTPNVIPAEETDASMVQSRLDSFLKKKNDADSHVLARHKPLGSLKRKTLVESSQNSAEGDDLMFGSPVKLKRFESSIKDPEMLDEMATSKLETNFHESPSVMSPAKSDVSESVCSSYDGSGDSGSELDLFSSPHKQPSQDEELIRSWQEGESVRLYISSDDDSDDEDSNDESENQQKTSTISLYPQEIHSANSTENGSHHNRSDVNSLREVQFKEKECTNIICDKISIRDSTSTNNENYEKKTIIPESSNHKLKMDLMENENSGDGCEAIKNSSFYLFEENTSKNLNSQEDTSNVHSNIKSTITCVGNSQDIYHTPKHIAGIIDMFDKVNTSRNIHKETDWLISLSNGSKDTKIRNVAMKPAVDYDSGRIVNKDMIIISDEDSSLSREEFKLKDNICNDGFLSDVKITRSKKNPEHSEKYNCDEQDDNQNERSQIFRDTCSRGSHSGSPSILQKSVSPADDVVVVESDSDATLPPSQNLLQNLTETSFTDSSCCSDSNSSTSEVEFLSEDFKLSDDDSLLQRRKNY